MKKPILALLTVFAVLCSAGCSSFGGGAAESGTTATSPDRSEPQSRLEEESDIPDPDPTSEENNAETPAGINTDLLSELGMTFAQLTEKYGEPHRNRSVH